MKLVIICKLREIALISFLAFLSTSLQGQLLLGANYNISQYSSNASLIELSQTTSRTLGISSEWGQAIVAGADLFISTNKELRHFEVFLKGGVVLNSTSRIQFPLFFGFGYATLFDANTHKYGDAIFGLEGHLRFYITDTFAFNGGLKYAGISVDKIDDQEFDETIGRIRVIRFSLGATQQF